MQPGEHCRLRSINSIRRWTPMNQVSATFKIDCCALDRPKRHGVRDGVGRRENFDCDKNRTLAPGIVAGCYGDAGWPGNCQASQRRGIYKSIGTIYGRVALWDVWYVKGNRPKDKFAPTSAIPPIKGA